MGENQPNSSFISSLDPRSDPGRRMPQDPSGHDTMHAAETGGAACSGGQVTQVASSPADRSGAVAPLLPAPESDRGSRGLLRAAETRPHVLCLRRRDLKDPEGRGARALVLLGLESDE
jgi:hypothetical protein